jgi:hypothetical protein
MSEAPSPLRGVRWLPTDTPLAPIGAAAIGPAAVALACRLLDREDLAPLRGVAGDRLLVVLGPADTLPWCDGVIYLGQAPDAPGALWPTTLQPDAPTALVARALTAGVQAPLWPVALLPAHHLRVPLGDARPIDRDTLRAAFFGGPA